MAFRKGLVLAACLLLAPCVLGDGYGQPLPTVCVGAGCDPSTHQENVTLHFTEDVEVADCVTFWDFLDVRADLSMWRELLLRYKANFDWNNRKGTWFMPNNKALLKNLAEINYSWQDFLALDDRYLTQIIMYNYIPNTKVKAADIKWNSAPVQTNTGSFLTCRPNRWRSMSCNGTLSYADVMPNCADLDTCNALVQITTGLLTPIALPQRPPKNLGCTTLYDYIASRGDMQHLKAAIDKVQDIGDGRPLKTVLKNPQLVATAFLPTDQVLDKWAKEVFGPAQAIALGGGAVLPAAFEKFDDLDWTDIKDVLLNHIVFGSQLEVCDLISGYMLDPLGPRYLLVERTEGRVRMWADESRGYILYPDIHTCSVVVHLVNYPLIPSRPGNAVAMPGYKDGADEAKVLTRNGAWDKFGDLVCATPHLSGFKDLIKGTKLEDIANDEKILLTWFAPTNPALLTMAAKYGIKTNDLFANPKYRLNFINYQAVPWSTLPTKVWADQQQFTTGYKPHVLTVGLYTTAPPSPTPVYHPNVKGELNKGDVEEPEGHIHLPMEPEKLYDIVVGNAVAHLVLDDTCVTDFRGLQ